MRIEILLIAVFGFVIIASTSTDAHAAAVDYFLKIDGVDGESKDDKHKGEIDIESWSWGATQTGSMAAGGGGGAGKVVMNDFTFEKPIDKATPKLFEALATGKHMKEAKLTVRKAGGDQHEYLTITLTDVMVTSYSTGGSSSSDVVPMESISLNFAQIKMSYVEQDASGRAGAAVEFGWDLKKNTKY
jgi:type VI secretion system secreted protein Hcp